MIFVTLVSLAVALVVILREQDPQIRTTVPPPDPPPVRVIPLDQCYATFESPGLQLAPPLVSDDAKATWQESNPIVPNVFLVRGATIQEAVRTTKEALLGGWHVKWPVGYPSGAKQEPSLWPFCNIGSPGHPPRWRLKSASVVENRVRVVIARIPVQGAYPILTRGLIWIPLGPLPEGTYALELYDQDDSEPLLSRRVNVEQR
jgi:hypothetical protein